MNLESYAMLVLLLFAFLMLKRLVRAFWAFTVPPVTCIGVPLTARSANRHLQTLHLDDIR